MVVCLWDGNLEGFEIMEKAQTKKKEAHMYFKRHKAGMTLTEDQIKMVKRFYPFMR